MAKKPTLPKIGSYAIVRDLKAEDLETLYDIESDSETKRYMKLVDEPREAWIKKMESCLWKGAVLAIDAKENGHFVGRATIGNYNNSEVDRELQVVISKDYQRRNFGREVCKILIAAAFDELDAERVFGIVNPENNGSLRLLNQFRFEKADIVSDDTWQRGHLKYVLSRYGYKNGQSSSR